MDRYEEALERAKAGKPMDEVFPELKDSEDERIRKALILNVSADKAHGYNKFWDAQGVKIDDVLAYLEKQKEQKPSTEETELNSIAFLEQMGYTCIPQKEQKPNIELIQRSWYVEGYHDREFDKEPKWIIKTGEGGPKYELNPKYGQSLTNKQKPIEDVIKDITKNKESATKFLKSAGIMDDNGELAEMYRSEQKPAEWSDEYREEDLRTRFAFYTYKDEDGVLYLSNVFVEEASRNAGFGTKIINAAEMVAETIGATTIRLRVKQDSPAIAWYRKNGYGYITFEKGYDWLEKNLEYAKPSKPVEWNEKDEGMLNCIIATLCEESHGGRETNERMVSWLDNRLKSLRSRLSDEEIKKIRSEEYTKGFNDAAFGSKQGWSEEDELMRTTILQTLDLIGDRGTVRMQQNWLKSLRPSWKPSNLELGALRTAISVLTEERNFQKAGRHLQDILDHFEGKETRHDWKPSEEQMKALNGAWTNFDSSNAILETLYNDLKKLM